MTYGVDQCRRCGAPIRNRGMVSPDDIKPSNIPEAEWRAAGFKAQPTVAEAHFPHLGCCSDCTAVLMRKRWKPGLRLLMVVSIGIVALGALYGLAEVYIP